MYRDLEKRRETTKERVRRYRALHKGVTDGAGVTSVVIPEGPPHISQLLPKATIPIIKTREDAVRAVAENIKKGIVTGAQVGKSVKVAHHPACKCFRCNLNDNT